MEGMETTKENWIDAIFEAFFLWVIGVPSLARKNILMNSIEEKSKALSLKNILKPDDFGSAECL